MATSPIHSQIGERVLMKKVHSPYATPVLNASDMCQANRDYYGCSSSDDEEQAGQRGPSSFYGRGGSAVPPPPSYVQATNAARSSRMSTRTSTPESEPTTPHAKEAPAVPDCVFHRGLIGNCEFIQPPQLPVADSPTPTFPCYRLFLGQIRFETTASEVRWILGFITGVHALKVESRGIGCFLAYFRSYDDMIRVQHLHKRILFDHSGIWYARSDKQADFLARYVAENLSHIGRGFRLPKDMMVVEEEKITRPLNIPNAPPQYPGFNSAPHSPLLRGSNATPPSYGMEQFH